MNEWKKHFEQYTLDRAREHYLNKKVLDYEEKKGGCDAAVIDRGRHAVSIRIREDGSLRMSCDCPVARGGRNCVHMAAALYAMEARETAAKEQMEEAALMEQWRRQDEQARLEENLSKKASAEVKSRRKREQKAAGESTEALSKEAEAGDAEIPARKKAARKTTAQGKEAEAGSTEAQSKEAEAGDAEIPARKRAARKTTAQSKEAEAGSAESHSKKQAAEDAEARKKQREEEQRLKEEREARQLAREARKAKKQAQKEEQKRQAEEALKQELEKRQAEEARREKIREQKAEEARRRMEKRQAEQEAARKAAERRQKEQEAAREAEEKRQEAARRAEEERQKKEEALRQEEAALTEAHRKQQEEAMERERRRMLRASQMAAERAEYETLGGSWEESGDAQGEEANGAGIELLEKYSYFKGNRIKHSMKIPEHIFREGEKLLEQGKIAIKEISGGYGGYFRYSDEITGHVNATGRSGKEEFPIRITFDRTKVIGAECGCSKCKKDYYRVFADAADCPYKAGVLTVLGQYLSEHNFGDATDLNGQNLIAAYQAKRGNLPAVGAAEREESLQLVPRLIQNGDVLSLAFKVGEKKLYVVKELDEFCDRVQNGETAVYGTNTAIDHRINNFTVKGREWIRFVNRIVQEEKRILERSEGAYGYLRRRDSRIGGELELFGWRLDDFYSQIGQDGIEFENRKIGEKTKHMVYCAEGNPKVVMRISEETFPADREFHGIKVEGDLPQMYFGIDSAYFIEGNYFCRSEKSYVEKIQPLADLAQYRNFSFRVGRNNLAEFYYRILPGIQDVVEVTETEPEKFRSFLPPEARFVFYLDAENQNITCGVYARYGAREVCALDVIDPERQDDVEPFRDVMREEWVVNQVMQLLPQTDWERGELHCGGDEALAYQIMEKGAQELMELGEVRCTKRFRNNNTVRKVKVAVGVSVSSGLLELTISSEDIPRGELLEILEGYREKRKYYRMKDGSFVNLEDSSLELLAELMEGARLKPKDFVKDKMYLPMYRTLYLDKMLEEHEDVYSERDSRFREVVKGFKTVTDADFEEPESLSRIMRKYQKNGFKWLRTLEAWQFGGILADDMGLGKTLQVISVLLSAKLEGKEGTSLIVVPASVVFNWGEELKRFAPQLAVSLIAGSQEERQDKLERWKEADVLVTSYDLLKRDIVLYEGKSFLYEVIDEAQYIKNHTTAAAKSVKLINSQVRYALTGTPIENRLSELWSIFDYLMPGFLYGYDVFRREMETPIVKYEDQAAMARLQKMVGPFILRRLKEDVLKDLPEKLEECRYVQFDSVQQKLYDAQVVHMKENIVRQNDAEFSRNKMLILAELTRLRQICCDPSLCFENYDGEAAKLEACLELIQNAMDGGHRMLVFSQFTSMLGILQKRLEEQKIPYYTITGGTSKSKRLQLVKEFNEGSIPVFLISLKAGGVGLNLTGADMVIHYDPWWNQAAQNQATDRAHRIGQTKKVTVYKLIVKNTIEEKIQKLQETKRDLAEQIIGGETGQLGGLSREELLELLEV